MLNIFKHFWQVNWAENWQYRANLLMYLFYWLVSPIIYMAVWTTVARSNGSVNGMTANDFIVYYMTLLVIDQLTGNITIHIFAYKIQDGTLAGELIRPVHPMLTNTLVTNLAHKALNFLAFLPIWGVLCLLFRPDYTGTPWWGPILAVPAVILGFAIGFLLSGAITCVAFWTTRVWALHEFYYSILVLFSGQFVPLQLMPGIVQQMARYLPFQLILYFPIQLTLGRLSPTEIVTGFASALVWLVVSYLLFTWTWREGVKRFSAVGA